MKRTRLLCAIGVSWWSAAVVGHQAAAPVVLSGPLRTHLRDERFGIVTSMRGLPLGVRNELQTLFGSAALDIAEPGDKFQGTGVTADPTLPIRRLGRPDARPSTASSTTNAAAPLTPGGWRCFTGRRPRRGLSGAVSRQAAWRQVLVVR